MKMLALVSGNYINCLILFNMKIKSFLLIFSSLFTCMLFSLTVEVQFNYCQEKGMFNKDKITVLQTHINPRIIDSKSKFEAPSN